MAFFDYIYIAGYREYKKFDSVHSNPRFYAVLLVSICILNLFALLLIGVCTKLFETAAFFSIMFNIFFWLIAFFGAGIYFIYSHYTEERTQIILEKFESQPVHLKNFWGWTAMLTYILPAILFALILHHRI